MQEVVEDQLFVNQEVPHQEVQEVVEAEEKNQ
jgi:hypothetical protein